MIATALTRSALAAAWRAVMLARKVGGPKSAARVAREHGLDGITKAGIRAMDEKAAARQAARLSIDPLIQASISRRHRCPSAVAAATAAEADRQRQRDEAHEAERRIEAHEAATAASLRRVARIARNAGWHVRSSRSRAGRISSYYLTPPGGDRRNPVRASDHSIPPTLQREYMAEVHGRVFDGYHGLEMIIDGEVSVTRIRRLLTLAAHGREPVAATY